MEKLTELKFIAAAMGLLSATLHVWFGKVDAGVYATVAVASVGGFLAAVVVERATSKGDA